jgi:hypothetical protein
MLMKMGWRGDGHGLGKNQQGVAKPIQLDNTVNRFGLGYDEYAQEMAEIDQIESISMMSLDKDKGDVKQEVKKETPKTEAVKQPVVRKPRKVDLINNIRKILIHFANSPSDNDLLFDKSLSAEDRKLIHQEAHKVGLKTRSEGSDQNRFIVVRKNINTNDIIDAAMRNGGQVSRYQVVSKGAV